MLRNIVDRVIARLEHPSWETENMGPLVHALSTSELSQVWNALDDRLDEHLTCVDRLVFQVYTAERLGLDVDIRFDRHNKQTGYFVSNSVPGDGLLRAAKVQWVRLPSEEHHLFREVEHHLEPPHAKLLLPFWSGHVWTSNASIFTPWVESIECEIDRIKVLPLSGDWLMNQDLVQHFVPDLHRSLSALLHDADWTSELIRYHAQERTRSLEATVLPDFN